MTSRCLSREHAAAYLSVSVPVIDQLIQTGQLLTVRLPVVRVHGRNIGTAGVNRRLLIDVKDLDRLVEQNKVSR